MKVKEMNTSEGIEMNGNDIEGHERSLKEMNGEEMKINKNQPEKVGPLDLVPLY